MRALLIGAVALLATACALTPGQGDENQGVPAAGSEVSAREVAPATLPSDRLATAWQQLFDRKFEQASASFDEVIGQTARSSNLHRRALLGQALVFSDPDWEGRDLAEAEAMLEEIPADVGQDAQSVVVFDWLLTQAVSRRVALERRQADLESDLAAERRRNRALNEALERERAERAEVEQTVARLRELIMGGN